MYYRSSVNTYVNLSSLLCHSGQPSTNGSTSRAAVAQLPKPVQPPAGPAYSVAAGGHHSNNSAQVPSSMSPQSQQAHTSNNSSNSSSNSMVNHIGGLLSPSSEATAPSSSQTMSQGSPLQNGPVSLMSPLSKQQQQQQMSGLLSMTSSLSIQKPTVNLYEQAQHIPNTTSSLSQSSTNSSFMDEAIFSGIVELSFGVFDKVPSMTYEMAQEGGAVL